MLVNIQDKQLDDKLNKIAEEIDLTRRQYEDAEKRYTAVGEFLSTCPTLSQYGPVLFPQGSFRLGTVTRPILEDEEYDVDAVCELQLNWMQTTQKKVKQMVGNRLKEPQYKNLLLPEKRRAWTLKYHEGSKFHLDVIPAITDKESQRELVKGFSIDTNISSSAINITDNESLNYDSYSSDWPKSNPKGYALWFEDRMRPVLTEIRKAYSETFKIEIDDIPFYATKTPLQKTIQILKRHRDMIFRDDEDKPISIIITTLSAQAYKHESTLIDTLTRVVVDLDKYIEKDGDGHDVVANPVDPRENFADKWVEYPKRRENFYDWLERVRLDVEMLRNKTTNKTFIDSTSKMFGDSPVARAFSEKALITEQTMGTPVSSLIRRAPQEQFVEELFPVKEQYKLEIDCEVTQDGWRKRLLRKMPVLRKKKSLRFFIKTTNVPKPYSVMWKVRNQGPEAQGKERGQIIDDNGKGEKVENSDFYGDHYVECFIIKNGACVARDRIDVPIAMAP